jgi:hypothetical protein
MSWLNSLMARLAYAHAVAESSRVELPFARDALELGAPTVLEAHAGAGGEVPDDAGDEHFAESASAAIRAPIWTAIASTLSPTSSTSRVCTPPGY